MKKLNLLLILPLTAVMALEFTMTEEGLFTDTTTPPPITTPPPVTTPPPASEVSNSYLEPVNIPTYDSSNPSHLLITASNDKWTSANLNSANYKHFYLEPGDYSSKTITLTADGTSGDRRSISLYNGNDTHPASLSEANQADVRLSFSGGNYWDVDRMSMIDQSSEDDKIKFKNGASNNILNRFYMKNYHYGMTLYHGANNNTIQNGYFDHMTHSGRRGDNVCISLTSYGECNGAVISGTKIINNDFRNAGDAIQLVRSESGSCSDQDTINYEGTILDSNLMWMDGDTYTNGDYSSNGYNSNGEYQIGENALDFKRGSENPSNPVTVTNNIMWGYKEGDKTTGGSWTAGKGKAITLHFGVKNFVFEDNIIFDSQTMFAVNATDPAVVGSLNNASFKNNIFYNSGQSNPENKTIEPLYFFDAKDVLFENNSLIGFTDAQAIRYGDSLGGNTFKNNVGIQIHNTTGANSTTVADNHYYDSSSINLGGTGNTSYPTVSEAKMTDYIFEYKRFTTSPKNKILSGVITTESSPHYGIAGSSISQGVQ